MTGKQRSPRIAARMKRRNRRKHWRAFWARFWSARFEMFAKDMDRMMKPEPQYEYAAACMNVEWLEPPTFRLSEVAR